MKKFTALLLALMLTLSLVSFASAEGQTDFKVLSARSALSGGYDNNPVLNQMQEEAGIKIDWETWSDSLGEVVGTRISGNAASKDPLRRLPGHRLQQL